ncbi:MAG: type II toxin-antitoxin system VapC family toxin [Elusimicrobia bacterium]|nr:type II toxin-antitoxin system VapC family toxin [Elusimicrobiota bacterium]
MIVYLDTSVILRKLLGEAGAIKDWGDWPACYTSAVAHVEAMRVVDRLRLQGRLTDRELAQVMVAAKETWAAIGVVALSDAVIARASQSFPTVLGTLDAIHLSSAVLLQESKRTPVELLTHDARLGIGAQAVGLDSRGFAGPA